MKEYALMAGRSGMYTVGNWAATPELAKAHPGDSFYPRQGEKLVVIMREKLPGFWTDSAGQMHQRYSSVIVVEEV